MAIVTIAFINGELIRVNRDKVRDTLHAAWREFQREKRKARRRVKRRRGW